MPEFKLTGFRNVPNHPELTAKLHSESGKVLEWLEAGAPCWNEQKSLPNDPAKALVKIADFIDHIKLTGQEYPPGCDKRAVDGWWQPVDFFYALQGIAHEARRVADQSSSI